MSRLKWSVALGIGLAAFGMTIGPTLADTEVPIQGTFTTVPTLIPLCDPPVPDCPFLQVPFVGEGGISHLGNSMVSGDQLVDFTILPPDPNQVGTFTITAANGDKLDVIMEGTVTPGSDGVVTFGGDITFSGGTGRFSDATGSGAYSGGSGPSTGFFSIHGAISY